MSKPLALSQLIANGDDKSELVSFQYYNNTLAKQDLNSLEYCLGLQRGAMDDESKRAKMSRTYCGTNIPTVHWYHRILSDLLIENCHASRKKRKQWEDIVSVSHMLNDILIKYPLKPELRAEKYTYELDYVGDISFKDTDGNECKPGTTLVESSLHPRFTYCVTVRFVLEAVFHGRFQWSKERGRMTTIYQTIQLKKYPLSFYLLNPDLGRPPAVASSDTEDKEEAEESV
ncbi:hypothetical protein H0H92_003578 [Tricholoma furcatifolium]|nr:hypothetical protein H0H92_003578 [Tricholoma furcatifolium]